MADARKSTEYLQPALLDRLTDDDPSRTTESMRERTIDIERLRAYVIRDLSWLLNTGNMSELVDLSEHDEVRRSVLNYGIQNLEGRTFSSVDVRKLERMLEEAIRQFEPRILDDTVQVRAVPVQSQMSRNALSFEIHGQLWADPVPLAMHLRTEVDLETGNVEVEEGSKEA